MEYINGYKAEESLYTKDGKEISVLRLEVENEEKVLDEWATHFREQYRYMEDLDFERHGTRRTRQEHLRDYVFPSDSVRPGPSTRVGDFCEILVADYIEFVCNYYVPRIRYRDKFNRNTSPQGSDKSRICSIIEEYGELELDLSALDKKEKEKVILEEYQVFSNPSYIFFKGNVDIHYIDGSSISATPDNPIAILSESIARIEMIKVNSNRIVTVENLTSYNRINDNKSTFIYLSGYHNTAKQRFLKKIAEYNSGVSWFHFGDIDPDGYYILKNLVEKTGIAFVPLYMDVEQLKNYRQYCKPLEKNDMVKANSLLKVHFYDEVMEFMLANNCKLEQEIISWLNERN